MKPISLFSRIKDRDDAVLVVRQTSIALCAIAVIEGIVAFSLGKDQWLFTGLLFAVPALFVWGFHSKVAAVASLVLFLGNGGVIGVIPFFSGTVDWTRLVLALCGFAISVRAVEATFKLQGRFARTPQEDDSSVGSKGATVPQRDGMLRSLIRRYQEKSSVFNWVSIILPPLLLTPLTVIPFDLGTVFFWMPAVVVFPVSVWHIAKFAAAGQSKRLIRPVLAVCVIVGVMVLLGASRQSADEFGRAIAREADQHCKANGYCPEMVKGLRCLERADRGDCEVRAEYGDYGAKYWVAYTLLKDRSSFRVRVRHDIDQSLILYGSVQDALKEELTR